MLKRLDRYILAECAGPFIFGLGMFFLLLVGVDVLYDALRMMLRQHIPPGVVLKVSVLRLAFTVFLTVPMATVFGTLMAFSRLSADGEIVAMRAGGISVPRIGLAPIAVSVLLSAVLTWAAHNAVPACNGRARQILADLARQRGTAAVQALSLSIPPEGPPERFVRAERFDPAHGILEDVIIIEYRQGHVWQILIARRASWRGRELVLEQVRGVQRTPRGEMAEKIDELRYELGYTMAELEQAIRRPRLKPEEMTTRQILEKLKSPSTPLPLVREYRTEIARRWFMPWSTLGFALVGVAFGLRPYRTSRGVALGLSLAVILAYYLLFQTFGVLAEQGYISPELAALLPDLALVVVGGAILFGREW